MGIPNSDSQRGTIVLVSGIAGATAVAIAGLATGLDGMVLAAFFSFLGGLGLGRALGGSSS